MKEEVQELIDCHAEGDYLDFKEENYSKEYKEELIKDLIAFANSHSLRDKFILIGAKEKNNIFDGFSDFDTSSIDESKIQQIVTSNIKDDLVIETELIDFNGHPIFAIKIPFSNNSNRPFMAKKQLGRIKENEMFIRRGSSTMAPTKSDLELMLKQNKCSKLVVKSYSNKLEEKITLYSLNGKIRDYRDEMYQFLIEQSKKATQLKSKSFNFNNGDFLVSKDKIEFDEESKKHLESWFSHIGIEYSEEMFDFNNIRWKTSFGCGGISGIGKVLYGDNNEKERYRLLIDLEDLVLEYIVINNYTEKLPSVYCTSLLISNDGTYLDEDIELKLIIKKEDYIDYKQLLLEDYDINYLGNLYKSIEKEFECPIISTVDQYSYFSIQAPNVSSVKYPFLYGRTYEPSYLDKVKDSMEDVVSQLEDLYNFEKYDEGDFIILKYNFSKVMQNSSTFIQSKLLFNKENVSINYEIKSKNNKDIIYGTISS